MIIRWNDIGKPDQPGSYDFKMGELLVGLDHIRIWKKNPLAAFYVVSGKSKSPAFRLSQFEAAVPRPSMA